jgi:MFS family permease
MNTILRINPLGGSNRTTPKARDLAPPDKPPHSVAWTIAASSFAFAVIQLDVTIVNVALSRISEDLGATVTELQWVVDAYTIGFAALLLSAGVISDRLGSKRVFVVGLIGFAAASLSCGLASGPGFLNVTRAIQGIGAALLVPSSLAILNNACAHDPGLRARAVGIWTAAGGVAIAAGPMVGGFLLTVLGWRSIFLVNIPICAVGLGLTLRFVPSAQGGRKGTAHLRSRGAGSCGYRADWIRRWRHRGSPTRANPSDGGRGRTPDLRSGRRIHRSRGANSIPNVTVTTFSATWFYSGDCFWRLGQLYLLRNHFCS